MNTKSNLQLSIHVSKTCPRCKATTLATSEYWRQYNWNSFQFTYPICRSCEKVGPPCTKSEMFWNRVHKTDTCWLWTGAKHKRGYGYFGKTVSANERFTHRFAWVDVFGEIPEGIEVCHACDNTQCVNPAHLFLGTHADNMQDMVAKKRHKTQIGGSNSRAILSEPDVREIFLLRGKVPQLELASRFKVSRATIASIQAGRNWGHFTKTL